MDVIRSLTGDNNNNKNLHAVEHAEQGSEGEPSGEHGLHLDQRQVPVIILQLLLVPFQFLLLILDQNLTVRLLQLLD